MFKIQDWTLNASFSSIYFQGRVGFLGSLVMVLFGPLETLQRRTSRRRQCGGVIVVVHRNGPGKSLDGKEPLLGGWVPSECKDR